MILLSLHTGDLVEGNLDSFSPPPDMQELSELVLRTVGEVFHLDALFDVLPQLNKFIIEISILFRPPRGVGV